MTHAAGGDRLVDGGLCSGADGVLARPGVGGLLRACARQGLVQLLGSQSEPATAASGGGALITNWAGPAGRGVELDHDHLRAALAGRAPRGAGLPLRAPDLAGLPIDGERGLVEPVTGSGLAGGV